jgi:hypothetical protein
VAQKDHSHDVCGGDPSAEAAATEEGPVEGLANVEDKLVTLDDRRNLLKAKFLKSLGELYSSYLYRRH